MQPTQSNSEWKLLSTTDPENFTVHKFQSEPWWKATQTAKWDGATWPITACYGDQILTEQTSQQTYCFLFTLLLLIGDRLKLLIHVCRPGHLNSNWAYFGKRGHDRVQNRLIWHWGSSKGMEEEREPLDRTLASSCSPGPDVAKAPRLMWSICVVWRLSCQHREHRGPHPHYTQMTQIRDRTSIHLTPSDHIHISYETTQEQKTPKATSRWT